MELSIEEKAKRYDEAIEIAKEINNEQKAQPFNVMTRVFPELKESEDESIRKWIIGVLSTYEHDRDLRNAAIAYLEKQGEQKPTAWSEGDEEIVEALNDYVKNLDILFSKINIGGKDVLSKEFREKVQHWLKSIKDRVQPKQEWSEEDEQMIRVLISMCDVWATSNQFYPKENKEMEAIKTWLKSLKGRYTWKPSDEQMEGLRWVFECCNTSHQTNVLKDLYNDLKKLREE